MSVETVILSIGVLVSLALGIINLLSCREKVTIINSEVYPVFLSKGTRIDTKLSDEPYFLHKPALSIETSCELVLTSGQKEIEVREVEVVFDKKVYEKLKVNFNLPHRNRLFLYAEPMNTPSTSIQMKKPFKFAAERLFDSKEEFIRNYGLQISSTPKNIEQLLEMMETNYKIYWARYDGKRVCWRFPNRWWRNLGKKLWG